jgi:hypothetical protein
MTIIFGIVRIINNVALLPSTETRCSGVVTIVHKNKSFDKLFAAPVFNFCFLLLFYYHFMLLYQRLNNVY